MTISERSNGFRFPSRICSLKVLVSRITEGRMNLSESSWCHCFRRLAGTMIRIFRLRSAHRWDRRIPASIVLPRPTSSARTAPFDRGDRKANSAASTWCGLRSTCASAREAASFSHAVGRAPFCQFIRKILCVISCTHCRCRKPIVHPEQISRCSFAGGKESGRLRCDFLLFSLLGCTLPSWQRLSSLVRSGFD